MIKNTFCSQKQRKSRVTKKPSLERINKVGDRYSDNDVFSWSWMSNEYGFSQDEKFTFLKFLIFQPNDCNNFAGELQSYNLIFIKTNNLKFVFIVKDN